MNRGKIYWGVPIVLLLVVGIYYFYGWEIGAKLHPDETAYSIEELTAKAGQQIDQGKKHGSFYVKNITEEEIHNINDYVCSMNGNVSQYAILENGKRGMRVRLSYSISDNYYVYDYYKNKTPIPGDRPEAVALYNEVDKILDKIIYTGMSDYEKELAIHDYIVKNCEYGYADNSQMYAFTSYGCLVQHIAVCNGYAEAFALLLSCAGVENSIMTGSAGGELHAWNRVMLDGKWYQVDPTWDDPIPDRGMVVGHTYFNVPDDIMDDSHSWEEDLFEPCVSMDENYFAKNGLICDYDGFVNKVTEAAYKDINGTIEIALSDFSESSYNFDFLQNIPGLFYYQRSKDLEPYGDYQVITIYFNQRN